MPVKALSVTIRWFVFYGDHALDAGSNSSSEKSPPAYLGYKNKSFIVAVRDKPADIWFEC